MRRSTADSASTQPGNHGDVHRGMPRSVINWHGGVLVVAGLCRMLFAITRTHRHTHTQLYLAQVSGERQEEEAQIEIQRGGMAI